MAVFLGGWGGGGGIFGRVSHCTADVGMSAVAACSSRHNTASEVSPASVLMSVQIS